MKTQILKTISFIVLIGIVVGFFSCKATQLYRSNGWYYLTDSSNDGLSVRPIVSIKDFEALRLDSFINSDNRMAYQITGRINEDRREQWADATEKSITKQIAFVYDNSIISAPQVNARIEGGHFSITTNKSYNLKVLYYQIKKEMEAF